ncbi:type II secretion system protein [Pseudomonas aeruginosa]|nr:type II secretion system protein [Pseudomonas aeruginosa]
MRDKIRRKEAHLLQDDQARRPGKACGDRTMRSKRCGGFISIELMIALVVIAIATAGGISVLLSYLDGLDEQHAAQQQSRWPRQRRST